MLAFWRIDPAVPALCAAGFTAFGLLASVAFGFARALPEAAAATRSAALDAGQRAFHAAVLALVALLFVHGWTEGWAGMRLLGALPLTDASLRGFIVLVAGGASWSGLLAIWRLPAVLAASGTARRP